MRKLCLILKNSKIITPPLLLTPVLSFSTLKQRIKQQKVQKQQPKSQIVSLLSDQLDQLSKLTHYSTSVDMLQKNQIRKSYSHLQYALTEAKAKYPQSINLQMFLLNRASILQKIVGQQSNFLQTLQQIFFMCLSLKGDKSLQTLKHLHNYMIALILQNPSKLKILIEYIEQQNFQILLKKSEYLIGISKYMNGEKKEGMKIIQQSSEASTLKQYKLNNLSWFQILELTSEKFQIPSKDYSRQGANKTKVEEQLTQILDNLITALIQSQKKGQLKSSTKQIEKNLLMTSILEQFVSEKNMDLLGRIRSTTLLLNSQSHIICMNVAYTLYFLKRLNQSNIFIKIALQSSIQLQEPYRIGLGVILLSKINYKMKVNWQQAILDLLHNKSIFSNSVIKHCLFAYSQFLFMDGRYYEAEEYANQAQRMDDNLYIEGLVLPNFDFSF